jgi:hypothetical protein
MQTVLAADLFDEKQVRAHQSDVRELAHRVNDGIEVTLLWHRATDELKVRVCDERRGACFEFIAEPHRALDVFYHPYAYASRSTVQYVNERLAAWREQRPGTSHESADDCRGCHIRKRLP